MEEDSLEGILFLHSETGSEGGYWAFQDSKFSTPNTTRYSCETCHMYWDKSRSATPPEHEDKRFCSPNDHKFELVCKETWSYEGLNILKDGDKLTIYHPDGDEVWSGVLNFKRHPNFTEDAFGYWIHTDQIGIDRETWAGYFFKGYSAKLIKQK